MRLFMYLVVILFYAFGAFAVFASKSDIQIILAVLCFGFGSIVLALNSIMGAVAK